MLVHSTATERSLYYVRNFKILALIFQRYVLKYGSKSISKANKAQKRERYTWSLPKK